MGEFRVAAAAALLAGCLMPALEARAQGPDLSGEYTLEVEAMTVAAVQCHFAGTAVLTQSVMTLSGTADLVETTGDLNCPPMPTATATGSIDALNVVSLSWTGADGTGSSTGALSNDDLVLAGPVSVSAGPFTAMSGTYTAERVIPDVAGNWTWTADLDLPGGLAGVPECDYVGEGQLTREVNQLAGSIELELVSGSPASCPDMPIATASGTIGPDGNLDIQMTSSDGSGDLTGTATADGGAMSGSFSVSSGPYSAGTGTFSGQFFSPVPSLTSLALLIFGLLVAGVLVLFLRPRKLEQV